MRNCNNCYYGSYGLDCSTGIENLYCCEGPLEFEVLPTDVCDDHVYIEGMEELDNINDQIEGQMVLKLTKD